MLFNVTVTDSDCRPAVLYFPSGVPSISGNPKLSLYASDAVIDAEGLQSLQEDDEIMVLGAAGGGGSSAGASAASPKPAKKRKNVTAAPALDTDALFAPQAQCLAVAAEVSGSAGWAVGVYNPVTQQLQLVPIAGGQPLRMEPFMRSLDYHINSGNSGAGQDMDSLQAKKAHDKLLVDSFGSTRRKRQLVEREDARVHVDKLRSQSGLGAVISKIRSDTLAEGLSREQLAVLANAKPNIPPHDKTATSAQGAFPLLELLESSANVALLEGIWAQLFDTSLDPAAEAEARECRSIETYVLGRLTLLHDPDADRALRAAKYLALTHACLKVSQARFSLTPKNGIRQLAEQWHMPEELADWFVAKFYRQSLQSNVETFERDQPQSNLLRLYTLCSALAADHGVLAAAQFEQLRAVWRMPADELANLFRQLGAELQHCVVQDPVNASAPVIRTFKVSLLAARGAQTGKTLADLLPLLKPKLQRK